MPRTPTRRLLFVFLSVLASACLYLFPSETSQSVKQDKIQVANSETLVVQRVVDGDTLILSNGEKARLTGIDTPESHANAKAYKDSQRSGQDIKEISRQGKEATEFVRHLAQGKTIRVEYDVQKRDRYGRLLIYAYDIDTLKKDSKAKISDGLVVSADREIFLNGSIIRSGYAVPLTIPPNVKHAETFQELYSEARSQGRGLWASK